MSGTIAPHTEELTSNSQSMPSVKEKHIYFTLIAWCLFAFLKALPFFTSLIWQPQNCKHIWTMHIYEHCLINTMDTYLNWIHIIKCRFQCILLRVFFSTNIVWEKVPEVGENWQQNSNIQMIDDRMHFEVDWIEYMCLATNGNNLSSVKVRIAYSTM